MASLVQLIREVIYMIRPEELVKLFKQASDEKWGYIWGAAGETWTQKDQNKATRDMTVKYGQQWVGRPVADCSGLFVWAFKKLGESIFHGSNTIWRSHLSNKGTLKNGKRTDGKELKIGTAVFQMKPDPSQDDGEDQSHIGLYIGNGKVVEAWSTQKGVRTTDLVSRDWEQWGELKKVSYDQESVEKNPSTSLEECLLGERTLKYTSPYMQGEDVKLLQEKLNSLGFDCGTPDGVFGSKTKAAVKKFQKEKKIKVDGVFGLESYAALSTAVKKPEQETNDSTEVEYIVQEKDTLWKISKKFYGTGIKYKKIMEANGMKSTLIHPNMRLVIPEK